MYKGIPVAFFVSDPRLCATSANSDQLCRSVTSNEALASEERRPTPCDDDSNNGIGPTRDAKRCKVPYVVVVGDCEQEEISDAT